MKALELPSVGYATNADHGLGCNIHPAAKQCVSLCTEVLLRPPGFGRLPWIASAG